MGGETRTGGGETPIGGGATRIGGGGGASGRPAPTGGGATEGVTALAAVPHLGQNATWSPIDARQELF
jgi:hypothetical protein